MEVILYKSTKVLFYGAQLKNEMCVKAFCGKLVRQKLKSYVEFTAAERFHSHSCPELLLQCREHVPQKLKF